MDQIKSMASTITSAPQKLLTFLVTTFFLKAPRILGGWEGTPKHDICASITTLPATFFLTTEGMENCEDRVQKKIESWQTAVSFLLLGLLLAQFFLHFFPWFFSFGVKTTGTTVHVHAPSALSTSRPPADPEKTTRATQRARETKATNELNAQKVTRYEEFFLRLLRFDPDTPLRTIIPEFPRQIQEMPEFKLLKND